MAKSLTETAGAVLRNQALTESLPDVPSKPDPDRGANSSNPNMATLKPKSKTSEGRFSNPNSNSPNTAEIQDLGPALVTPTGESGPAKAGKVTKKAPARRADKQGGDNASRKLSEDEDFEISEELEAFIDELVAEGLDEDEIAEAIAENFEFGGDDDDGEEEISEELEAFIDALVAEGLDEDEIAEAIAENFELQEDTDEDEEEEAPEYEIDMSEHVEALLEGEDLSEEFREKATTIFEAAVKDRLEHELSEITEAYDNALAEEIQKIHAQLSESVDDYLNYVVEQWVSDNEVAIESSLRNELTEDFISGLKNLFSENYIDIPEEKIDVVEELSAKVDELESKLDEEIDNNVQLSKMLNESRKTEILSQATDGLTDTQAEKIKTLAEGVEYTSDDKFESKVKTLRESYFPNTVKPAKTTDSEEEFVDGRNLINEELTGAMGKYVKVLGKKLPN
tara:strand:- start:20636 stop:21994 length:1359 start_codon:yes stop_codon:yes gene_type:complete